MKATVTGYLYIYKCIIQGEWGIQIQSVQGFKDKKIKRISRLKKRERCILKRWPAKLLCSRITEKVGLAYSRPVRWLIPLCSAILVLRCRLVWPTCKALQSSQSYLYTTEDCKALGIWSFYQGENGQSKRIGEYNYEFLQWIKLFEKFSDFIEKTITVEAMKWNGKNVTPSYA